MLLLLAKEGIRLESMTGIAVQGVSDIMALYGAGTSSLCVNGSVDMMDVLTGLGGSTYRNYAPYADAPEEGEFDWGGFARNLVMGLAVGAACIAMSLLLPGIGTIAAGALMGAGIGAISASVAGAVGDYSSGNVRSAEEAIRDMAIAAISGAITGAVGVKFPGMNRLVEGGVDTTVAIAERAAYAALDGDMTLKEKLAYVFDPGQMAVDFVTGVFIGKMLDGMMAGIQNKLRSIFASNDAAMREALGIGDDSINGGVGSTAVSKLTSTDVKVAIERNGMSVEDFSKLLDPNRILTPDELKFVGRVRTDVGLPQTGTVMNKTIPQSDIYNYLYNENYSGVRGFVSVNEHSNTLKTLADVFEGNRLDYNNTAFKIGSGVGPMSRFSTS